MTKTIIISVERMTFHEYCTFIAHELNTVRDADYDNLLTIDPEFAMHKDNGSLQYFGILADGVLSGYAAIDTNRPHHLSRIYVSSAKRKLGLGSHILEHFEIETLYCLKGNAIGCAFYEKNGFTQVPFSMAKFVLYSKKRN